jgi:hypothetical protein
LQYNKEIVSLVDIGVLEQDYSYEWASCTPSFAIHKKNGTIRIFTDFRKLNLLLKRHPFPNSKIGGMIRSMEGFYFDSVLDLNMGYYQIKFDADADADSQKLCTIIFSWGKHKYKRLTMGIKIVRDVFRNVMSKLIQDMDMLRPILMIVDTNK